MQLLYRFKKTIYPVFFINNPGMLKLIELINSEKEFVVRFIFIY